ncbi:unnamed protein product [Rhodiola kirilowii]
MINFVCVSSRTRILGLSLTTTTRLLPFANPTAQPKFRSSESFSPESRLKLWTLTASPFRLTFRLLRCRHCGEFGRCWCTI